MQAAPFHRVPRSAASRGLVILVLPLLASACHRDALSNKAASRDAGTGSCHIREVPLPTQAAQPGAITVGPDGNLWLTEDVGAIARVTPAGTVTEFPLASPEASPGAIVAGADGALWFTEVTGNRIGRITTTGTISEMSLPRAHSNPCAIVRGADGQICFSELGTNPAGLGRLDSSGALTKHAAAVGLGELGMAAGPDGRLWLANTLLGEIIALSTAWETEIFKLPTPGAAPDAIVAGRDDNLWFSTSLFMGTVSELGRITTSGEITELPLPEPDQIAAIAAAGDGLWFTNSSRNLIGHLSFDGDLSECPIPTPASSPLGIVVAPDGAVWFTEQSANQVGELTPD